MDPVPVRALHLLYTPLNNYRRTFKEGKHIYKSMSETRNSGGVYNYWHREPTAEQVGLDVQRELEMKTLDIIYLKCRYLLSAPIQIEMDNTFLHSGKTYC